MLVDPKFINYYGPIADEFGFGIPKPIKPGIYGNSYTLQEMCEVELVEYADKHLWDKPVDERIRGLMAWHESSEYIPDYGMCDDGEQLLRRFPHIITSPTKYILTFTLIDKSEESNQGGFRPHKNGTYYGEKDFQGFEYFADEPNMDHLFVFHVFRVTDTPNPRLPPPEKWPEIQERLAKLKAEGKLIK